MDPYHYTFCDVDGQIYWLIMAAKERINIIATQGLEQTLAQILYDGLATNLNSTTKYFRENVQNYILQANAGVL
ncbi:hypothetical protein ACTXT7_007124 [Hymenolepis weldensis]